MNSADPGRVAVVGSLNVDVTLRVVTLPAAGQTVLAQARTVEFGGKGANQAMAAASQGSAVRFVAAVGDDEQGRRGRNRLVSRGVDVEAVQVVAASTGTAMILVADDGENLIVVDQGANAALAAQWVRDHVAAAAPDVVLAQLEVPVPSVLAAAEAHDPRFFILNPAPIPADPDVLTPVLEHVDLLVPNGPELAAMAGHDHLTTLDDVDACAADLGFHGVLVVTLGGQGCAVYGPRGRQRLAHIPAPAVDVVDTTGAGDAFCGVLADRLARGGEVLDAVRAATALAAFSTTVPGAQVPDPFVLPQTAVSG